jgi:BirA family biotin operon repressor/biotin-[acetyl-CoA-carboxylase] ligase
MTDRMADPQVPADIAAAGRAARARSPLRLDVRWFASLASTMDVATRAADDGAGEGLVVIAGEQTSGRGRRGHGWSSPPGAGVYLSFLLRPSSNAPARVLSTLTLAAGVASRAAIERASGFAPDLKWPNDLMCGRRKLAGILAESVGVGSGAPAVILGIGINLLNASHPPDVERRATSLEAELGRQVDRGLLLEELLVQIPAIYVRLCSGDADGILREWREAAPSAVGTRVEWDAAAGLAHGTTAGIDDEGALLIRTAAGVERVISGEVRWT